jgi:preprotein translocase subunit SecA
MKANRIIPKLIRGEVIEGKEPGEKYLTGDYTVEEKSRSVALTDEGFDKAAKLLGLTSIWDLETIEWKHHVEQALKAHVLFHLDKDYVVKDGEVIIVDEFTGRLMPGRRWSDGLHQAVEAKEGVKVQRENQTLATITFQNYFRMYKKLAGMTGTAETEAAEFDKIYKLDVVVIPTNRSLIRKENPDVVYRTEDEKFRNAAKEIKACNEKGQPVLVGTISVEKSERLSGILKKMGVRHEVLNAKNHEREAFIVAQAGRRNQVTVSTNMAGRGTDILLGGNPEFITKEQCLKEKIAELLSREQASLVPDQHYYYFLHLGQAYRVQRPRWDAIYAVHKQATEAEHEIVVASGGLHIVGTERHESRRIDNQLRGRAGRQGDPGSSRFYLSLQDDLLRIFGGERIQNLMLRLGMDEDVPIESKLITRRIRKAQEAVEAQNFGARKHLIEYDDVMNKQREAIYGWRRELLEKADQREKILDIIRGILVTFLDLRCPPRTHVSTWDLISLETDVNSEFGVRIRPTEIQGLSRADVEEAIFGRLLQKYEEKEQLIGAEAMREMERLIMLHVIDTQWKDNLLSMDHLKEGIGLRGYGQKDPLVEYKKESFILFQDMMDRIEDETIRYLFFLQAVEGGGQPASSFLTDEEQAEADMEEEQQQVLAAASQQQREAAQSSIDDFTRNIQRKNERQMAQLQFAGGEASSTSATVVRGAKTGRNDPCPCGSGKKYKKCCGANA